MTRPIKDAPPSHSTQTVGRERNRIWAGGVGQGCFDGNAKYFALVEHEHKIFRVREINTQNILG